MVDAATAQELALAIGLRFEDADLEAAAPLVDAALVWLDDAVRERFAASVVEALWPRGLREDIEAGLTAVGKESRRLRRAAARARADLAAGPGKSRLARAVVEQAAGDRAFELQLPVGCIHCLDEGVSRTPEEEHPRRALAVARMAGHAAAIPEQELREAFEDGAAAFVLATDERRAEVRWWLRRIAMLGQHSIPHMSAALFALLDEPMPAVEHDEIWREAVDGLERRLALQLH